MRGASCLLVVAACSGGSNPATVRTRITTDLGNVLHQAQAASQLAMPGKIALGYVMPALPALPDPDAAIAWLTDTVFTDADYLGGDVFRFPAESVCKTDSVVDPACVAAVDQAQLRIRVQVDDQLRFYPQLGPNHDEPIEIDVTHDGIAVHANLDGADAALLALAAAYGGPAPAAQLSGELTLELQVVGPAHVLAAVTVDRPIAIALADPTGLFESDGAIRFAAPASQPLSFEVDATARTFVADLAVANVTAHLPGRDFMLAAATGDASYDGSALALTGVALSASESVNAHVAATLAVSSFDATLADAAGLETLTPSPRLELASFVDHGLLGDAAPAFDVTHLVLDGAVRGDATMLAVMTGALTVTTSPTPFGFVASAGACVTADPWAVATCN